MEHEGAGGRTVVVATVTLVGTVMDVVVGAMTVTVEITTALTVDVRVIVVEGAATVVVERVTPIQEHADAYEELAEAGEPLQ